MFGGGPDKTGGEERAAARDQRPPECDLPPCTRCAHSSRGSSQAANLSAIELAHECRCSPALPPLAALRFRIQEGREEDPLAILRRERARVFECDRGQVRATCDRLGSRAGRFAPPATGVGSRAGRFASPATGVGLRAGRFAPPATGVGSRGQVRATCDRARFTRGGCWRGTRDRLWDPKRAHSHLDHGGSLPRGIAWVRSHVGRHVGPRWFTPKNG